MSSSSARSPAIPTPPSLSTTTTSSADSSESIAVTSTVPTAAPNKYLTYGLYASVDLQIIDDLIMLGTGSVPSQQPHNKQTNQTLHAHQQIAAAGQSNAILVNPAAISALSVSTKSLNLNPFGPTSLHFPGVEHVNKSAANRNTLTKSNSSNNLRHEPLLLGAANYHRPLLPQTTESGGNSLPSFYNNYLPSSHSLRNNQPQPVATATTRNSLSSSFSTPSALKHVPALSQASLMPTTSSSTNSASLLNRHVTSTHIASRSGQPPPIRRPRSPIPEPAADHQMSSGDVVHAQQPIQPPPITNASSSSSASAAAASRSSIFPHSIQMLPSSTAAITPSVSARSPHEPLLPPFACLRSVVMSSEFKRSNGEKCTTQVATPKLVMELYASKLTPYEHHEIVKYPQIYFIGANAKKRPGTIGAANNSEYDNEHGSYIHIQNDHVAYRYEVLMVIGKGSFGQVVKAYDHKTHEHVALKMVRNEKRFYRQAHEEIRILEHLRKQDKDNAMNIIHMYRSFEFRNHVCITFEILYINLYELIRRNKFYGFSLQLVRKFAHALLQCLDALAKNKIIHCDMKPENVMLKQQGRSGIKVS